MYEWLTDDRAHLNCKWNDSLAVILPFNKFSLFCSSLNKKLIEIYENFFCAVAENACQTIQDKKICWT